MVGASPRTLSTRVRAQLSSPKLLLRTDRFHLWLITTASINGSSTVWRWGWGWGQGQDFPPDIRKLELKLGQLWERTRWDKKLVGSKAFLIAWQAQVCA